MTASQEKSAKSWKPSPRPEWVRRINEEGDCMDIAGIVPLDEQSLLNSARANTGLSDFGDPSWYEPFKVLVKSLDTEARLNLMGRLMTRSDLLMFLEARLQVEDTYKKHPEINDQEISQPMMIIGRPRSGTSFLQNLLSMDPDNAALLTWEIMFPCPPPEKATYQTDPRIDKADRLIRQWDRVTPEIMAMHEFSGRLPNESTHLECLSFVSPGWFNLLGQVPSYNAYSARLSWVPVYEYEKRVLKLLQWQNPRKRWTLKSTNYTQHLPDLLKVFPDACLIWVHRDPIQATSSLLSLLGTQTWARSDHALAEGGFLDKVTRVDGNVALVNQVIDWLEDGVIPKQQLCNIQYRDMVSHPVEVVERMYAQFGIPLSEQSRKALDRYMAENPRSSRPAHAYAVGDQALVSAERRAYQHYQEYFGVESEV